MIFKKIKKNFTSESLPGYTTDLDFFGDFAGISAGHESSGPLPPFFLPVIRTERAKVERYLET